MFGRGSFERHPADGILHFLARILAFEVLLHDM